MNTQIVYVQGELVVVLLWILNLKNVYMRGKHDDCIGAYSHTPLWLLRHYGSNPHIRHF